MAPRANWDARDANRAYLAALKMDYIVPYSSKHTAYLTISAFSDGERHIGKGIVAGFPTGIAQKHLAGRRGHTVGKHYAISQRLQSRRAYVAAYSCLVGFRNVVAGMGQAVDKASVIG